MERESPDRFSPFVKGGGGDLGSKKEEEKP
jgi:hypothetical protein